MLEKMLGKLMGKYISSLSQLYRLLVYSFQEPKTQLENAMFIISIDVDVGDKELGKINKGQNDSNVSSHFSEYYVGEIEELALPLFADLFNRFGIPVTFAVRGQLTEVNDSSLELLLRSPVKHDIGAHGYYHREFKKLSHSEAEEELEMIAAGMKRLGHAPKSFVFPRNSVAYLDLLSKQGYRCYRGLDRCLQIEQKGELYDVHPSLFVDQNSSPRLLMRMLDVCTKKRLPFHIWSHLWNFGRTSETIQHNFNELFCPVFEYAKTKVESGVLKFETMASAAEKVDKLRKLNTH